MSCRIACLYDSYGSYEGLADFWVQIIDGRPAAVLAKYSGNITFYALPDADTGEIEDFINTAGYMHIEGNIPLLSYCPAGIVMRLENRDMLNKKTVCKDAEFIMSENYCGNYKDIYSLMNECRDEDFAVPEYGDLLLELSHRVRHKTAYFCMAELCGRAVSFAMTVSLSSTSAVIGAVCTLPEYRNMGLGSACIGKLAGILGDREVFVIRAEGKNEDFYQVQGFV